MSDRVQAWLCLTLVVAATAIFPARLVQAQTTEPLIYRRIFAPSDALDGQIRDLLPLKREEFGRRLAAIQQPTSALASQTIVRIEQAAFRARLDGSQLVGQATFLVAAAGTDAALLPLQPCSFTIESAFWNAAESRTAIFGADQTGKLLCLVDHSGELSLKWRQAANEVIDGRQSFALQFPSAPYRRLEINAPANIELAIDSGLIVSSQPSSEEPDRRNWLIELTGATNIRLEANAKRQTHLTTPRAIVRDTTAYNVLPAAVDFETTVNLDVLEQSLSAFSFTASQPIHLLSVQVNGQPTDFRVTTDEDGQSRYLCEIATPLAGADHVLTIAGTASRPAAGAWILPRVRWDDCQFQEGLAQIVSPAWMRLSARPLSGCVQTGASAAGSVKIFDRQDFQLFSPSASVEISLNASLQPLQEDSGTQINIESNQVTGVYIGELTSTAANRFEVAVQISRNWVVDAVETQPQEMLADRTLTGDKDGSQQLQFKLVRPISASRPLRVIIRAHYRRPASNEALDVSFFRLAKFPETLGGRQLVSVQVHDSSSQLVLSDDATPLAVSAAQLTARERSLFEEPLGGLIFENDNSLSNIRASLVPATARYQADVRVQADVNRHSLGHHATIHVQPEASTVASVLVRLSPAPASEVSWRLVGETPRDLPATLETHPLIEPHNQKYYRVLLPRPLTTPFDIVAEWSQPIAGESDLTLVALPEATRQQGLLEVHSPSSRVAIHIADLQPLPFAPSHMARLPENRGENPLRGRYRYAPDGQGRATVQLAPADANPLGTWIESLHVRSYFSLDGAGEHEARLIVHGGGESALALPVPPRATTFRLIRADGSEDSLDPAGGEHHLQVPLSSALDRMELRLRYCSGPTIADALPWASLNAPMLEPQAVVLSQSWEVILPPQFIGTSRLTRSRPADLSTLPASVNTTSRIAPLSLLAGPGLFGKWIDRARTTISSEAGFAGWKVMHADLPPGSTAHLIVYRTDSISAACWALVLLGVALVGWFRRYLKWLPAMIAFCITSSCCAVAPWSLLVASLAAGLVAGGVLTLFWNRHMFSTAWLPGFRPLPGPLSLPVSTGAAILLAIGLSHVAAAPPPGAPPAQRRPKVVFPVDANQQPAGDYVYVEESLYQRLHQSSERGSPSMPGWLLEGAKYEFPSAPKIHGETTAIDELRATFDFFTFHSATIVRLPLRREQLLLLEGRARLDGQPAVLTWRDDGQELSLPVPEAGKHRLELALGATARQMDDGQYVTLALPPAAHSSVTLPPEAELHDALSWRSGLPRPQTVALSTPAELHLFWPASPLGSTGKNALEAEQYSLWRVHAGSVVLESQFRLKPIGDAVKEVTIEADPRLRPLPSPSAAALRTTFERGTSHLVRIEFLEPITTETSLNLTWLWPDVSGLGQFEFPTVHLRTDRLTRDLTAIALDSGITLDRPPAPAALITTADFVAAAGESDSGRIVAAWDASTRQSPLIATRPESSLPLAEEAIAWSISDSDAAVTGIIQLTNVAKTHYEHRFLLPPQLRVRQVGLTQGGKSATLRWAQHAASLTLSLLEPPETEQTITLQAELPRAPGQRQFHLSQIVLEDVQRRDSTIALYRQPSVQVTPHAPEGWQRLPERKEDHHPEQGRLIAAYRGHTAAAPPMLVTVQPNQPRLTGKMLTRVAQADGDWTAEVEMQLEIAAGLLDELRLSVPGTWADRLSISPDTDQTLEGNPGDVRRRLVLRPRVAASGTWTIRIRGTLLSGTDGLRAPDVSLEGQPQIQRLVMLDPSDGASQIDWTTTGLVALDELSQQNIPREWRGLSGSLYQVVAQHFEATAHARHDGDRLTQVHLADIRAVLLGNDRLAITAHMLVSPVAMSKLEFSLPPGCRLLQTLVDGVSVPQSSVGLRSWQLTSLSSVLPYRLTIVYDLPIVSRDHSEVTQTVAAPRIVATTVAHTLWSFDSAQPATTDNVGLRLSAVISSGKAITNQNQAAADLLRLESLARTIEDLAATQGENIPLSVITEAFVGWDNLLSLTHRRLQSSPEPPVNQQQASHIRAIMDSVAKIRLRWQQTGLLKLETPASDSHPWLSVEGSRLTENYVIDSEQPEIQVVWSREQTPATRSHTVTMALLAVFSAVLAAVPNFSATRAALSAHAHFVLGATGFGWWLLAPYGWLGLLLMLFAGWLALRPSPTFVAGFK